MIDRTELLELIDELQNAAVVYYQGDGNVALTDEEFDAKVELLEECAENSDFEDLFFEDTRGWKLLENDVSLGTEPEGDTVVSHEVPMLSLGKAKSRGELATYAKRARKAGANDFVLQAKLDGFALSVTYENSKLVRLATRGTGSEGEDISYLNDDANVTIVGIPAEISRNESLEVRGELFFTDEQFKKVDDSREKLMGERFRNSRNAVVGLMKAAKLGVDYPVEFNFSTYSVLLNNKPAELSDVDGEGFITVDNLTDEQISDVKLTGFKNDNELFEAVEAFGVARNDFTIPTDGVVIKPTNEAEMMKTMGMTSHHPSSQIAYKYPGATADSEIVAITVTVGKTGKLTPRAEIKPVLVAGTLITNLTMSNYNWVAQRDVRVGSQVRVHRANDVIPEIKLVLHNPENTTPVVTPTHCPSCGDELGYDVEGGEWPPKTLLCENLECPSRDLFALKTAVSKNFLDIDGLSDVTLNTLVDSGRVRDISDFYTLTLEELANSQLGVSKQGNPRRLGEKRAQNILTHIEKSKTLPLYRLLISLNIAGLGPKTAKDIVGEFKVLETILELTPEDLEQLNGFGEIVSKKIVTGLTHRRGLIAKLQSNGVAFAPEGNVTGYQNPGKLDDLSFAISGSVPEPFPNRTAWVDFIEASGGEFHSAPKRNTSFMIGDENAASSKVVKAKRLGVEFMTFEEFTSKFVK